MKTAVRTAAVSQGFDEFETVELTIANSAKGFRLLLDQLYPNKPRAAIREIWTNAFDAHVAAGIPDRPFICYLPTALDNSFTVRDYGVSMTHEQVMHLYTRVFDSTKTEGDDANTQVGCHGLGSKAPFAYTDAYTVTRWLDGVEQIYLLAIGTKGIPTCTALPPSPSDEPRGVQVSFPVEPAHFDEFAREASVIAQGFDTPPECPGLILDDQAPRLEGDGWRAMYGRPNSIRQGCVIYPVTSWELPGIRTCLSSSYGLIVDVPIGTVDIGASRESLSYDPTTTVNARAAFAAAAFQVIETAKAYVNEATDLIDANERWNEMVTVTGSSLGTMTYKDTPVVLNGCIEFAPRHPLTPKLYNWDNKFTIDKVRFPVASLASLHFLVIRSDGPKIPRRTLRLKSYIKNRSWNRSASFILHDPTPQQLAALVRRLRLRPDQIIGLAATPDVEVSRSARGSGAGYVPGVYTSRGAGWSTNRLRYATVRRDELADEYLWIGLDRITDEYLYVNGFCVPAYRAHEWLAESITRMGIDVPVYFMTKGAQDRLQVTEDTSFATEVTAWMRLARQDILADEKVAWIVARLQQKSRVTLSEPVINSLCAKVRANAYAVQSEANGLIGRLLDTELREVRTAAEGVASTIAAKYPLLFSYSSNDDDVLRYIASAKGKK